MPLTEAQLRHQQRANELRENIRRRQNGLLHLQNNCPQHIFVSEQAGSYTIEVCEVCGAVKHKASDLLQRLKELGAAGI